MQAYKLKGIIDRSGHLSLAEPLNIPPGEVEVILLQSVTTTSENNGSTTEPSTEPPKLKRVSKLKLLRDLLDDAPPVPPDFDPDEARWEALKEKYDL
jgi:hypothetical protein